MVLSKALVQHRNELPKLPGEGVGSITSITSVNYNNLASIKALATVKPSSSLVAHNPHTVSLKVTAPMSVAKGPKDHRFRPHGGPR